MSNFQEELKNDYGFENVVIIAIGQTNISSFNNSFCANSDLPLVMDEFPELPIREQFSPYGESHDFIIVDYDGNYLDHINFLSLGGSDLSEVPHDRLNKVKATFSYYTAHLDRDSLSKVTYHPKPAAGTDEYEDLQRIQYFRYVKERAIKQAATFGVSNIPSPESSRWDIITFDTWKLTGSTEPLNEMDLLEPLEHWPDHKNPTTGNIELSPLDNEFLNDT